MLDKLTEIIREYTDNENVMIDENTVLVTDLGLSSLDLVDIACLVEDVFDVEIPDRVIINFRTVGDVIAFLKSNEMV